MRRFALSGLIVGCACLGWARLASAQSDRAIHGTVVDSSEAVVADVPVQLQDPGGSVVARTTTSANGQFSLSGLRKQNYVIVIAPLRGFAASRTVVPVKSPVEDVVITLLPQTAEQTVVARSGQMLSPDAASNLDATTVSGDSLQHMPAFDQDYVTALIPFLDPASSASDGVTIMVNGIEMKASTVTPSAIAEIRINDDPYSAEFSRPGRGRINIIPKPGSSDFHGTLNFIMRDAVFNASNYFSPVRPPEQRRIYEGDLTGPLGTGGRTMFIGSGSRREEDTDAVVHAFGPNGIVTANVPAPQRNTQVSMSVSHDFSESHRASIGYNFELQQLTNSGVGGLVLAEAGVNSVSREDDLFFGDRMILSPKLFHQLQLVFEKDEDISTSATDAPSLQIQDAFTGGGAQADISRTENTVHVSDAVSWTQGRHYIRFGINSPQISRRALDDHTNRLGTFAFSSLADYLNNRPDVWTAQQGLGRGLYWINELGAFAQDEITIRPGLRLTLGLRYQWQTYISDRDNFAPRVSIAWSAGPHTVVRTGAGLFYDRTGGDYPGTFKVHNGTVLHSVQVLNPGYPSALPPGVNIADLPTSLVREAANVRAPYKFQYSADLERQLNKAFVLTVGYSGITGVSMFRSRDANAPLPPSYASVPDPSLAFVQQIESGGRLSSNSMEVTFRGRGNRWFTGQAKYVLSRTMDNTGGIDWYPQNQYRPNDEWARSSIDRLHRFNLIGRVNPDHWLTASISATLYSAAPYTETAGADLYHTGLGNARLPGVARNTLTGGSTTDFDLLWDHDVRLGHKTTPESRVFNFGVSAFNVLNHPNFVTYAGSVSSPLFRQPTTALLGRQIQFGLRYSF